MEKRRRWCVFGNGRRNEGKRGLCLRTEEEKKGCYRNGVLRRKRVEKGNVKKVIYRGWEEVLGKGS